MKSEQNMDNIAIVIQGPSKNVIEQKKAWEGYLEHCIFSTWVGEESNYSEEDCVVYSDPPEESGPMNFNYQMKSTSRGLEFAKSRGYTRALKVRSDLVPTNYKNFLNIIDNQDLNFLCWHYHEVYPGFSGYLVDYLMSGRVDTLIDLWKVDHVFNTAPEILLTLNYITMCSESKIQFFLDRLSAIENDLWWIKPNINLSSYKKNEIYDRYDSYPFDANMNYLKSNYINF